MIVARLFDDYEGTSRLYCVQSALCGPTRNAAPVPSRMADQETRAASASPRLRRSRAAEVVEPDVAGQTWVQAVECCSHA